MYELRTTRCAEHGHPECVLAFDDPSLAEQGEYWIGVIERGLETGLRFEVGKVPVLDGWPVAPVLRPDGALALHAYELENYRQARTTETLDTLAHFARAQRTFARSYGAFDPPHWLMSVTLCPRWKSESAVLTREAPEGNASGWVIHCHDQHCSECGRDPQFHCPSHAWIERDIAELAVARPRLVHYLGLAPGHRIDTLLTDWVEAFDLEYGHDIARFANLFSSGHLLRRVTATSGASIELDFERDADIIEDQYGAADRLRERYGLDQAAAAATLARATSYDGLVAFARWRVRDKLTPEHRELVERVLAAPDADRWKLINEAARALVRATGTPFNLCKPIVEQFDRLLERAKRARK